MQQESDLKSSVEGPTLCCQEMPIHMSTRKNGSDHARRVDIVDEGREPTAGRDGVEESLSERRVREIEHRLETRFYDQPSVAARVAERLLATGAIEIEA